MANLKGPLFSLTAQKQLGKALIYKTKSGGAFLTKYNKPGGNTKFTPSASQTTMREHYAESLGKWQSLSDADKEQWNDFVK